MVPTIDLQVLWPTWCFLLRLRPNIPDSNITDVKVQTAFWKYKVISSERKPGTPRIIQPRPFPVVILHSSLEAPQTRAPPLPSPAHHSPLSLRRSQGNSGAVKGTCHHISERSLHTSAFSAPPAALGLLLTSPPAPSAKH